MSITTKLTPNATLPIYIPLSSSISIGSLAAYEFPLPNYPKVLFPQANTLVSPLHYPMAIPKNPLIEISLMGKSMTNFLGLVNSPKLPEPQI